MFNTTANKITLVRIILIPMFLAAMYFHLKYVAFGIYILACVTDAIDGYIARHYNQITDVGKFMDPLADKILVLSAMCFFVENRQMAGWIVAIVLFREFSVSGLRLVAARLGRVIAAAKSGKVKTAATMVCLGAMILFPQYHYVNVAGSVIIVVTTLWSGIEYFAKNYTVFFPGKEREHHEDI